MFAIQNPSQIGGMENFHFTRYPFNPIDDCNSKFPSHELSMIDESKQGNRLYEKVDGSIALKEKDFAYIIGEKILRPTLYLGSNAVKTMWETSSQIVRSIDGIFKRIFQIFPVAQACEVKEGCGSFSLALYSTRIKNPPMENRIIIPFQVDCEPLSNLTAKWNLTEELRDLDCMYDIRVFINETSSIEPNPTMKIESLKETWVNFERSEFLAINLKYKQKPTAKEGDEMRVNIEVIEGCLRVPLSPCSFKNFKPEFTKRNRTETLYFPIIWPVRN